MKLEVLTRDQVQQVREWRNNELQFLRTPYMITEKMQNNFYDDIVQNRDSKHRYFAITEIIHDDIGFDGDQQIFIGMGGLTNIEWENSTAEISLIINPSYRGKGHGKEAVDLILNEGFNNMGLYSIYGEVYECGNKGFWEKIIKTYSGYKTKLVDRKLHNGIIYDSMWFSIKG